MAITQPPAPPAVSQPKDAAATTDALREAEQRYRLLFDASPIPLCVIDNETLSFLAINEAALHQYGYSRAESAGKTLRDIFFAEDFPRFEHFIKTRMRDSGRVIHTLVRHRRKDGQAIWVEVKAHDLIFEGRPARIFQGYDITRRKLVEEDLRLTQAAIDKSKIAFFRVGPDGTIEYVNQSACDSLGYKKSELIGMRPWDFDLDFPEAGWNDTWKRLRHERIFHLESRQRRKDGSVFPVQVTGNYIKLGDAEYSFTFVQDISDRKAAESNLKGAEERYRVLFDASPVPIGVFDTETFKFLAFNDAGLELYGYAREDAAHISALDLYYPEDQQRFLAHLQEEMRHPDRTSTVTMRNRKKDGSTIWIEAKAHPIVYDGRPARIVLAHDITRRLQAEEELRRAEAHYRLLFESNPVAMGIYDPETLALLAVNDAALRQYGYTREEATQLSLIDIYEHEELPRLKAFVEATADETSSSTWKHRRKNGELFWVQISSHTIDYRGKPARLALAQDITEIKIAQLREHARGEVLELLAKGAPLGQVLSAIALSVEQENPAAICGIQLLDDTGTHMKFGAGPSLPAFYNEAIHGLKVGIGVGSCGTALASGERVVVEDIQTHPYWAPYREITQRAGLAACWSNPIVASNGKVIGSFAIYHRHPSAPSQRDIELIEHSTHLAGIAIERSLTGEAMQLASLVYQNSAEGMLVTDAENRIIAINPAFTSVTGYTLEEVQGRDPGMLSSGRQDHAFYLAMWNAIKNTGQWQGEIWNRRKDGSEYAEWLTINTIYSEDGAVHRRVALFSDITERKQAEALIWNQANYDNLTQLPNRRLFNDRLEQELKKAHRDKRLLGLLFIDLDRFKEVNDTLGHHMGDELLVQAAKRIQGCLRESDSVARLGGDEFTVILPELTDISDIGQIAQNIIDAMNRPFLLGADQAYISASVGITVYPEDAQNVENLLKNADQAMYAAKRSGRNRYSFFTPSMQEAANLRMRLIRDIHQAMTAGEFMVYFQPIVEISSGEIHKAEALLRWNHPVHGFISPATFIPIAEDTGLIHDIGNQVFEKSVQQVKRWREQYRPDFQISVNKSPIQFRSEGDVHNAWVRRIREMGLTGDSIVIEITEGLLLNADSNINAKLLMFRDAGIQVAIDDFGTGYSSLSYLKKFDIDYLKIDQSFVMNLESDASNLALSEAIVVMAHKLGLKVIAEGVETAAQRDLLHRIGCDYAQGYLFSKPVPAEEFERLLEQSAPS